MHTDKHQLLVLFQIPPSVINTTIITDIFQNLNDILCTIENSNRPLSSE